MGRCEVIQDVWNRLKDPVWCRGGLCGVDICVDPLVIGAYETAARDIAWELQKHDYVFRVMPGERCVSVVYSDEIRGISFTEFINQMAATIYPKGDCPQKLYWKISMLGSGLYCSDELAQRLGARLDEVLACVGETGKERVVVVKAVGGTYFVVFGPIKRIDSPLFK